MTEYNMSKIPAFTEYIACPTCHGSGWMRSNEILPRLLTCPHCQGKKRVPVMDNEGKYEKKGAWQKEEDFLHRKG